MTVTEKKTYQIDRMELFLKLIILTVYMNCPCVRLQSSSNVKPKCHSKSEFDYHIVQKLVMLENQQKEFMDDYLKQINDYDLIITDLEKQLKALSRWEDWAGWSECYNDCSGSNSGRVQNRTRETPFNSGVQKSETEIRPCNSIQFIGCVKSPGGDDNFGIAFDYKDQLAQATCTAMGPATQVNAVRRTCSNTASDCTGVCKRVGRTCFNQLHVYAGSALKRSDVGKIGLSIHKYDSCSGQYCGPNFCCCRK